MYCVLDDYGDNDDDGMVVVGNGVKDERII